MATGTIDRTTKIPEDSAVEQKFQYPGMPTTCDGAEAVVWVETKISQGSGALTRRREEQRTLAHHERLDARNACRERPLSFHAHDRPGFERDGGAIPPEY